jgi:hypothetical protein
MSTLFDRIKTESPLAFQEFDSFINERYGKKLHEIPGGFAALDFPFQIGVFWEFFQLQSVEFEMDLLNYEPQGLKESVVLAFQNYEKVIAHFS